VRQGEKAKTTPPIDKSIATPPQADGNFKLSFFELSSIEKKKSDLLPIAIGIRTAIFYRTASLLI